jgi:exonuclease III
MNKRGVGILLKNSLNFTVLDVKKDRGDNILCAKLQLDGKVFIICAIYGPNKHDPIFFTDLRDFFQQLGDYPTVVAGDWNCTVNCQSGAANVDTLNMRTAPNVRHSKLLKNMCNEFDLCDPYRAKFPNRIDFTYVPRISNKNNRSRIDFFIVSSSLLPEISCCEILPHLQNKLFDHKAISLSFKDPPKVIKQPTISRSILKDPDLDLVVSLSVAETYLHHIKFPPDIANVRQTKLEQVGRARAALILAGPDSIYLPPNSRSEEQELDRAGAIAGIKETIDELLIADLAERELLEEFEADVFMETLINNLRNDVISFQIFIQRTAKKCKKELESKTAELKKDYELNSEKIFELESKLNSISNSEILNKIEGCRDFNIINGEKITPFFLSLATSNKAEAVMSSIKNDDGTDFPNSQEMKNYVRNYYAKLYTPPL